MNVLDITHPLILDRTVDALIHATQCENEQAVIQLLKQISPTLHRDGRQQAEQVEQTSELVQGNIARMVHG